MSAQGGYEVGSIYARVGFDADLTDKTRFEKAYDDLQAKAQKDVVVHARVDADRATGDAASFQAALERMRGAAARPVVAQAKVDADLTDKTRFDRAVQEMRAETAKPIVARAKIDVDEAGAGRFRDSLGRLREANGRFVKESADGMKTVGDGLDDLDGKSQRNHRSGLDLSKTYESLNKAASALPRPLQLIGNALVAMSRAGEAAGKSIGGSGGGVVGAVLGLVGGVAGLGGAIGIVLILLSQLAGALVAVAASATFALAGVAALGAGMAAAFGPFLLIGIQVVARVVAIGEAYKALSDVQDKSADQTRSLTQQHVQSARAIQSAEQALGDARRTGAEQVRQAQRQLEDARRAGTASVADAERRLADVVETTTADQERALDHLVDVREQGLRDMQAAQDAANDARVSGARDVQAAETDLADAQARVTRAQTDLTRARHDATRETEDLARAARDAGFAEEEAALRLREARKHLAEVRADPKSTQLDVDRALQDVKEAEAGIGDARDAKKRADEDAAAGTTKVKEAENELAAARSEATKAAQTLSSVQRQAAIAVSRAEQDAAKARQDAAATTRDAESDLSVTVKDGARERAAAQKAVATAVADAARTTQRAAEIVAKAREDETRSVQRAAATVAAARQAAAYQADQEGAAARTAKQKLDDLDETERHLLITVRSFVKDFSQAMRPATDAIFDGVDDGLDAIHPLLERYEGEFGKIGDGIGDLIRRAARSLAGPEWIHALDEFVETAEQITEPLGDALGSVVEIVRDVALAAQPYVRDLADGLADGLGGIADQADDTERMSRIVGRLLDHTRSWWHLLVDVGKLVYTIFNGGAEDGQRLVDTLDETVKRWTKFLGTEEGQREMRDFFHDSVDFAMDLADGIADVTTALMRMGHFLQDNLGIIKAMVALWAGSKLANMAGIRLGPSVPVPAPGPAGGGVPGAGGIGAGARGAAGSIATSTLYGAAAVGGVTAITQALKGPSGTDVGLVNKYADALLRVVKTNDSKGMRELADQMRETARANQDLTKGENLKRFADALDATAASGGKSVDAIASAFAKLPASVGGSIEDVRRQIGKLAGDRSFDDVGRTIKQAERHFADFRRTGSNNLHGLHVATDDNMRFIKRTLGEKSAEGKAALAKNYELAQDAVRAAMTDMKITSADGMREIRRLFKEELTEVYGLTDSQANDYMRKGGHGSGNETSSTATGRSGNSYLSSPGHQRGGYVAASGYQSGGWLGGRGMVSDDIVPIGDRSVAALGEYVAVGSNGRAVINRHQAPIVDAALAATGHGGLDHRPGLDTIEQAMTPLGGLDALFAAITRPHMYAQGGYVQGAVPAGGPAAAALAREMFGLGYNVTSARRNTSTYHGRAGTGRGDALDFGNSANDLRSVWRTLFPRRAQFAELFGPSSFGGLYHGTQRFSDPALQAGHEDHVHVAILNKLAGALGTAASKIKAPTVKLGGMLGGVAQGALNATARAANARLAQVGDAAPAASEMTVSAGGKADPAVVAAFRRAIRDTRARPVERLGLWEGGIVESGLRNLNFGDADSLGALQERVSIYGRAHALNPYLSAVRFLRDAAALRPWGGTAGMLAAAVQRPRADLRGRYDAVAGQARGYLNRGGRFASGGRVTNSDPGHHAIDNLRSLQTDRVADYDNWMAAADRKQSDYGYHDRKFSISVEELINPDTGAVDVDQVKKRANELIQLSIDAGQRTTFLKEARKVAKRVVDSYRTILERLRRARSRVRGSRTFITQRRGWYDGRIDTYAKRLEEWTGKIPGLNDTIRESELDVDQVAKEYQDVIGTKSTPPAGDDRSPASDDLPPAADDQPPAADDTQPTEDQKAIADQANARADALAAQVGIQERAIRQLGGPADFGQGGRTAFAAAGGSGLGPSLQGVGGLSDVYGVPIVAAPGQPIVVQQFAMMAPPRDPATLQDLGRAAVSGLDHLTPQSSPRVQSPL